MSSRRRISRRLTDAFSGVVGSELGAAAALFDAAPETAHFRRLPVERIRPRAERPRRAIDEAGLEELVESVRHHGVLQPIRVRAAGAGRYEIIAGERRWLAARQAGLRTIPAIIAAVDDDHAFLESLVENVQREDLNAADRAEALRHLRVNLGLQSWEEVGRVVGLSRQHVHNLLRIADLPERMQDDVRSGGLTEKHSRALLLLRDDAGAQGQLWRRIHDGGLSGDAALAAAKDVRGPATASRRAVLSAGSEYPSPVDRAADAGLDDAGFGDVVAGTLDAAVAALVRALVAARPADIEASRDGLEALQGQLAAVLGAGRDERVPAAVTPEMPPPGGWRPLLLPATGRPIG
ncbi:MAG TPA: ParB/RepB/Spo0J family partition protein [Candidatus Dormibacteraeota bacterium]|jgi:ParB family chromosome partitioning protein|nr:ParB/RepB/Spo0J family partition protein [Candidatus Dormibacteraeota bacterium]